MTTQELLIKSLANPQMGINIVLQNNPEAIAQKAIDLGLTTTYLPAPSILEIINDLLRVGDTKTVERLLSVPFNSNAGNETENYAFLFEPYKGARSSDGEGVDWWTVAGSALIGGLSGLMNQNAQSGGTSGTGTGNTNTNQQGVSNQNEPTESNTVLIVVAFVFGIAILTAIGYFLVKAAK